MTRSENKGSWTHRALTVLFSVVLAILCFWLLGFVLHDIGSWPGPLYKDLEKRLLDPMLVEQERALQHQIADTRRKITDQKARQELLRDSTANSQRTMNQLLEFQRLSLEKDVAPSADEQKALAESQQRFLANQKQYQLLNEEMVRLSERLGNFEREQREVQGKLATQRDPIQKEFDVLQQHHDLQMAAVKLAVLVPLLLAAVGVFFKLRSGPYAPPVYAYGIAVVLKVGLVMHEYFPARYFKYVLIMIALAIVIRILIHQVRMVAFPKAQWLMKQYREAYETFRCPICSFPIRRGPLKYMVWTRRSIRKISLVPAAKSESDEPYVCPVCSTRLFGECEACHAIRHSLLPSCQKCGHIRSGETAGPS